MTYIAVFRHPFYMITCEETGRMVCDSPYAEDYDEEINNLKRDGHTVIEER